MGVKNLNLLRSRVRNIGNIRLNQSLIFNDLRQRPHITYNSSLHL